MRMALNIESLSKTFRNRKGKPVRAVDGLNLSIPPGIVFGFLGPNGAGKTTTIKMMCGLITPTSGNVKLNGFDVSDKRTHAINQIGAVLEGTRNVYWRLSAWENLVYFGRLKGKQKRNFAPHAERLLRDLELWDRRSEPVRTYSRGMQQKVAIACSLVADPPVVLLDEPTLGLDVQATRTVKSWIEKLASKYNKTVVLTTHQLDMAQKLCDRIAIISKGQLVTNKPVADLLELFRLEHYNFKVSGRVNSQQTDLLNHFTIDHENNDTILSTTINDQQALYHQLEYIRQTGLRLISVNRAEPNIEEIFVRLLSE
jgi:ABC-2 type transport system ATP-binding protein